MREKELKLEWIEDTLGDSEAKFGEFILTVEQYYKGGELPEIELNGYKVLTCPLEESHRAAQLAAEQAARELCEQFKALGEVLATAPKGATGKEVDASA